MCYVLIVAIRGHSEEIACGQYSDASPGGVYDWWRR